MVDLTQYTELIVRQRVEMTEAFSGFETANRYQVSTPEGTPVAYAHEESGFMARMFLKNHRPLTIVVRDADGQPLLTASRRFFWFWSHLHVSDGSGMYVGSLRRRFTWVGRRIIVEDSTGAEVARIRGRLLRPNTFMVYQNGTEVARVTKRWSGLLRESFSDADTFQVQMEGPRLGQQFCLLMLAAAFAVDLDFFEKGGRGGGLGG